MLSWLYTKWSNKLHTNLKESVSHDTPNMLHHGKPIPSFPLQGKNLKQKKGHAQRERERERKSDASHQCSLLFDAVPKIAKTSLR